MLYAKYNIQSKRTFEKPFIYDCFFLRLRGRCANSRKQAGATTNKISSVNLSHMFLATSLGCIHEVVQFSPALGVVSHIIMSIIHRFSSVKPCKCRDEVSEQKYFTLQQFLGKKGSTPQDFIHRLKIKKHLVQLTKKKCHRKVLQRSFHWLG